MNLVAENISKSFLIDNKKFQVLSNISLEVKGGEFVSLIGPSGCGKSTFLRVLAGLEKAETGSVSFDGKPIAAGDARIAMIFQHFALFPWMTVAENIEFGLIMRSFNKDHIGKKVRDLIEEVGLAGFSEKHPKELSGGMRQRVGIARALACDPQLLLLDEPFSALDAFTADILRDELLKFWQKRKLTAVMVTHLVDEAIELGNRIVVFTPRPAKIEKIVENNLTKPINSRSQEFFNLVDQLKELVKV